MNNFDIMRSQIISTVEEEGYNFPSVEIYIICNVYSRFAIYLITPQEENDNCLVEDLRDKLKDKLQHLDTINIISRQSFIYDSLKGDDNLLSVNDKNIFYLDRYIDKINWFTKIEKYELEIPIVAFYSFKGGLGRTTAMVTTAIALAREGKKVVLMDFDLEAPGLSSFFTNEKLDYDQTLGIVDFIINFNANGNKIGDLKLDDFYFLINDQHVVGDKGGELYILPAVCADADTATDYVNKLAKINLHSGQSASIALDSLLTLLYERLQPNYIFIDTRTGVNDIGGLIFNRYATTSFLFFFGNEQNMFGLKAIIPQLKKLDHRFYLVNSPVPLIQEEEEIVYYLNNSYDIFCKYFYDNDNLPDMQDNTAEHFPINVYYTEKAVLLNHISKLGALLEGNGNKNGYFEIASYIKALNKNNTETANILEKDDRININNIVVSMSQITKSSLAASEIEFETVEDLKRDFYPRKEYKFIFDKTKFLIIGEKGAGKTALYSVLTHPEYAKNLAAYCDIPNHEFDRMEWIRALDISGDFPTPTNFQAVKGFSKEELRNYWLFLLIRYIPETYLSAFLRKFKEEKLLNIIEIKQYVSQHENIAEELEDELKKLDVKLQKEGKFLMFIYDYLDFIISEEKERGKIIGILLSLWYDFIWQYKNIKAKIFLRKDIFESEVYTGIVTDRAKISNYKMDISWTHDQLLNVVWKRLIERNVELQELLSKQEKPLQEQKTQDSQLNMFSDTLREAEVETVWKEKLGFIPLLTKSEHENALKMLLGNTMGARNKAVPYNWVCAHIQDANNQIQPRTIITLFAAAARNQISNNKGSHHIMDPYYMEIAMGDASEARVADLQEEYASLKPLFENLKAYLKELPVESSKLKETIEKISPETSSSEMIKKLCDIGVFYEYKYNQKDKKEKRYHIPDLYLFGLGLKRRGQGAHKAILKKFKGK